VAPSNPRKLALTSPTSSGRLVGIVRLRTQATEFSLVFSQCTWADFLTLFNGDVRTESKQRQNILTYIKKQTPWPESVSELYRPGDSCLSAKLVQNFANRGVSRSKRGGSLTAVFSIL
jgi:hypothetical protein